MLLEGGDTAMLLSGCNHQHNTMDDGFCSSRGITGMCKQSICNTTVMMWQNNCRWVKGAWLGQFWGQGAFNMSQADGSSVNW
jgi:hypothetical protein